MIPGYLAPGGGGPGLLLLHEWWGLNDHIRSVADRFAKAGFSVAAADLYGGRTAKDALGARGLMNSLTEPGVEAALDAALDGLLKAPGTRPGKVGVLGFCMGGRLALWAGTRLEKVGAVVDFYGGANPPFDIPFHRLRAPVLALFGARDRSIPAEARAALEERVRAFSGSLDMKVYEADHAFFNDTRPEVYDPLSASDAFDRAVKFLKERLS